MKETGLMFKAPLVRSILDGTKTQTRRVMKPQPVVGPTGWHQLPSYGCSNESAFRRGAPIFAPRYGQPGDLLWVRETFAKVIGQSGGWIETDYFATYTHGDRLGDTLGIKKRWTPSIHMPRDASRIDLEIIGLRVERLQDITDADALAEGVDRTNTSIPGYARERFRHLWESTGGDWAANPWVWVIDFKRIHNHKATP